MCLLAGRSEALEGIEDVLAGVRDDPVAARHSVTIAARNNQGTPYRISASLVSMARCSACLTAICSRSDSQGHSGLAGALQMAQLGAASISSSSERRQEHYCELLCGDVGRRRRRTRDGRGGGFACEFTVSPAEIDAIVGFTLLEYKGGDGVHST